MSFVWFAEDDDEDLMTPEITGENKLIHEGIMENTVGFSTLFLP